MIQSAIDALPGGGIILLKRGTYNPVSYYPTVDSYQIFLRNSGVTLQGEGIDQTILKLATIIGTSITGSTARRTTNSWIKNLTIDGTSFPPPPYTNSPWGVMYRNVENCGIDTVKIYGGIHRQLYGAFDVENGNGWSNPKSKSFYVQNCIFDRSGPPVPGGYGQAAISFNHIENIYFSNNLCQNNSWGPAVYVYFDVDNLNVVNLTLRNNRGAPAGTAGGVYGLAFGPDQPAKSERDTWGAMANTTISSCQNAIVNGLTSDGASWDAIHPSRNANISNINTTNFLVIGGQQVSASQINAGQISIRPYGFDWSSGQYVAAGAIIVLDQFNTNRLRVAANESSLIGNIGVPTGRNPAVVTIQNGKVTQGTGPLTGALTPDIAMPNNTRISQDVELRLKLFNVSVAGDIDLSANDPASNYVTYLGEIDQVNVGGYLTLGQILGRSDAPLSVQDNHFGNGIIYATPYNSVNLILQNNN